MKEEQIELEGGPADGEVFCPSERTLIYPLGMPGFLYLDKVVKLPSGLYECPFYNLKNSNKAVFVSYWTTTPEEWNKNSDITRDIHVGEPL